MEHATNVTAARFLRTQHWWDEHPPADPAAEPLYALALEGHVAEVA